MTKIFNRDKFEKIKAQVEAARAANAAALEDMHFYRERFQKQAALFKGNFKYHNKPFGAVHDSIDRLARADAVNGIDFFEAEFSKVAKLLDGQEIAKQHLEELFRDLLDFKTAQIRSSEAIANMHNVAAGFDVLEDFARKHIKKLPVRQINAVPENQPKPLTFGVGDGFGGSGE